jgi:hypothetical protein
MGPELIVDVALDLSLYVAIRPTKEALEAGRERHGSMPASD